MASRLEALIEAEKRGLLPQDKQAALNEMRKRGLVPSRRESRVKSKPSKLGSFGRGVEQGVTFGFGDEVKAGIGAGVAKAFGGAATDDMSIGQLYDMAIKEQEKELQSDVEENPISSFAGNIVGSIATGSAGASRLTGTKAGAALAKGGLKARVAKGAAAGGAGAAVFGAGAAKQGEKLEGATKGGAAGLVLGGAIPLAVPAAKGIKSLVTPTVDKTTAQLAKKARDFNIPLRLDQLSPTRARRTAQKISQNVPFSGVDVQEASQLKSFNKAVARTLGRDANALSPDVIQAFRKDNSSKFSKVMDGIDFKFGNEYIAKLNDIVSRAGESVSDDLMGVVNKNAKVIVESIGDGNISGEKLLSLRSRLLKNSATANNQSSTVVNEMINAIDDVVEASIPKSRLKALNIARREYRNFKTIQPLLEKSTDGNISPTQLLSRVSANKFIDSSKIQVGDDDLVDLARIGKKFLAKAGGSDTAEKLGLIGGGAAGVTNPLAAASVMGANRAMQAANQSQRLVDKVIKGSLTQAPSKTSSPLAAIAGGSSIAAKANVAKPKATIKGGETTNDLSGGSIGDPADTLQQKQQPSPQPKTTGLMAKIAQAESGGNPNAKAKTSSASGLFQFTDGTWRNMVKKYGKESGIAFSDKNNPDAQQLMAEKLALENSRYMSSRLGKNPTGGEVYIAHFLGAPKATRLIKRLGSGQKAANIFKNEAKANRSIFYKNKGKGAARTVDEVYKILVDKVK